MDNKTVLRVEKHSSKRGLRGALAHNLRVAETPNADPEKTKLNQVPTALNSIEKCLARYDAALGEHKPRKNAIHSFEVVVSGSPEKMAQMTPQERTQYFTDAKDWLCEQFGGQKNLVSMVIHNDEKTAHAQFIFIPMHEGRLSYKHYLGGHRDRLSELQSDFAKEVSQKHGFTRGLKGSKATHTKIKDFYKEVDHSLPELKKQAESLRAEIEQSEKQAESLREGIDDELKRSQERLGAILEPMVTAVSEWLAVQTPDALRRFKMALGTYQDNKPELPDQVTGKIDQIIDDLSPVERPVRRQGR